MKLSSLTIMVVLCVAAPAFAADWVVNSTRDALDSSPGDRVCSTGVTLRDGALECTLRAALQEVNARVVGPSHHWVHVPEGVYVLSIATTAPDVEDERQLLLEWSAVDAIATGDLDVDADVLITGDGEGRTVISGAARDRVIDVVGGPVTLQDLTLERGLTRTGFGGCLFLQDNFTVLQLTRVTIQDCRADERIGGGMYNRGVVWMERVTFRNNRATRGAGLENAGVARINESTFDGNRATPAFFGEGGGGGISNLTVHGSAPHLELTSTTLSNNEAAYGGGLLNRGRASLHNVTVSRNQASRGGGIAYEEPTVPAARGTETLVIRYSTIARNTAGRDAGILRTTPESLTLSHVLLTTNTAGAATVSNCSRGVTASDHSLENGNTCLLSGDGDLRDTAPLLGPLADNGGPTETHALAAGSPAIDAGVDHAAGTLDARDQRGVPRPLGRATDIGAFEFGIDPATLIAILPVRFAQLFPHEIPGVTIPYTIDLSMDAGKPPKEGSDGAAIMGIKAGDFQGQLQFMLDKSGLKVSVKGVAMLPKPSDNPDAVAHKDGPVLFYVEVRRAIRGAARLRVDQLTCECDARLRKHATWVIPPYKANDK